MKGSLYPVSFKGKNYYESDCNDIFVAFYHSRYSLAEDCSVYVSEGERIQPDGTWVN